MMAMGDLIPSPATCFPSFFQPIGLDDDVVGAFAEID